MHLHAALVTSLTILLIILAMYFVGRARGKYIGICGQGPSDHADFAEWLMEQGIESISLNPDTVVATWQRLARAS